MHEGPPSQTPILLEDLLSVYSCYGLDLLRFSTQMDEHGPPASKAFRNHPTAFENAAFVIQGSQARSRVTSIR